MFFIPERIRIRTRALRRASAPDADAAQPCATHPAPRPLPLQTPLQTPLQAPRNRRPIAAPEPAAVVERELALGPGSRRLQRCGRFVSYAVAAGSAPTTLRELGRLRELCFRGAGEGTGNERDIDPFDASYEQIVLWDARRQRIAGGYRVGHVQQLRALRGVAGLYTHTLFDFAEDFAESLSPGLELGRSFVSPDYQRQGTSLYALWKAIGARVLEDRDLRWLFGPVSISADYAPASRALIGAWLRLHAPDAERAATLRGRQPFTAADDGSLIDCARSLDGIEALDARVRELESGRRGVPVLLRHYLGLGGRVAGLSVDARFADVLDALLCVDLRALPAASARRYLGAEGLAAAAAAAIAPDCACAEAGVSPAAPGAPGDPPDPEEQAAAPGGRLARAS